MILLHNLATALAPLREEPSIRYSHSQKDYYLYSDRTP